jgi:hydrogenase maturation protease
MEEKPGTVKRIDVDRIKGQIFSTHKIPTFLFIQYLKKNLPGSEIILLGIQPKQAGFNAEMSKECEGAVEKAGRLIMDSIKGWKGGA